MLRWRGECIGLVTSKHDCWWNWERLLQSVQRLLALDVADLLPGHGHSHHLQHGERRLALEPILNRPDAPA